MIWKEYSRFNVCTLGQLLEHLLKSRLTLLLLLYVLINGEDLRLAIWLLHS